MAERPRNHTPVESLPDVLRRFQRLSLRVGAAALALGAIGLFFNPRQFFASYLLGFMLVIGVTLGSMALLMLHHLTGGEWGVPIRRILEAITRNVPVVTLMFAPLLLGVGRLYEWADPGVVHHDEAMAHKAAYLNTGFFLLRAAIYFAAWNLLALLLRRWSDRLERTPSVPLARRIAQLSGPGILVYVLTMTFASIDWVMSLEPHWYSTIFGMLIVVGQVLSALAVVSILLARVAASRPLSDIAVAGHYHDIGNLMLAFVMLWAYMSFSQYLIIWSGNLSEETPFYVRRTHGGWGAVAILLVLFHFALPFVMLLSRSTKRSPRLLSRLAILIVVMRAVDLFWVIAPAVAPRDTHEHVLARFHLSYMDICCPVGLAGLWVAATLWQLGRRPLLPATMVVQPQRIPDAGVTPTPQTGTGGGV